MAHELDIRNGKASMFFVGETPWHGLGTKLEGRPTSEEAIRAAGLDWKVGLRPLFAAMNVDENGNAASPANFKKVAHRATYREDTGEILGVVGPSTTPLQNVDAFKFFDPFVAGGQAGYETAGALQGGRRVWILAALESDPLVIVPKSDDTVRQFLLLSNSHDGTLAIRVGFTPIRVVCANTLAMAHNDDASKLIKISHHAKANETLAKVGEIMNTVTAQFEATAKQYRELAAHGCNEATLKKYVNLVFNPKTQIERMKKSLAVELLAGGDGTASDEDVSRSRIYPKVAEMFEGGRGNDLPGVRGTMWAAYNAISEYIVHERGKDAAKRLDSAWFGPGHAQNARALKIGIELATT
jgi:phage/plasmid-like protein (TIGR03299 family)